MKRVNYYLTDKQVEKLQELSKDTDLSVSEHIRRAIDLYLQEQKNVSREKVLGKGRC